MQKRSAQAGLFLCLTGPFGSPMFACAGKNEPPSRLVLSQNSAGKAFRSGYGVASILERAAGAMSPVGTSRFDVTSLEGLSYAQ